MNNLSLQKFVVFVLVNLFLFFASTTRAEEINRVDVFAEFAGDTYTSPDSRIVYWDLLKPEKSKSKFFPHHLSVNPEQAKKEFSDFLSSEQGKHFVDVMKESYKPMLEIAKLRVEKTPAIVINKRYVIYGTTSVEKAIQDFQEFKKIEGVRQP